MKKILITVLKVAGVLVLIFVLATRNSWIRAYRSVAAAREFVKRFPGAGRPQDLSEAARNDLAQKLVAAMADPDRNIHLSASAALGRFGPLAAGSVPALIALMDSPDLSIRYGAANTLEHIAALAVPFSVTKTETDDAVRWRARKALLKIATPEALAAAARYPDACPAELKAPNDWCVR